MKDNEKILAEAREEASQIISEAKDAGENLKNKLSEEGQEKYDALISNYFNKITNNYGLERENLN